MTLQQALIVPQALGTYPYFFSDVLCLSGLLLAARSLPVASHRRLIVRLGLINIPNGVFSVAYPDYWKDYWHPSRVGGWVLGPEDMLFGFNVGAMGCLAAVWLYRHQLMVAEQPVPRIGRILAVGIPTQCAFLVLFSMCRSGMASAILAQLMALVLLLLLRPELWRFSAAGGIGFPLMYGGVVKLMFWIWPDFVSCWTGAPPWGWLLLWPRLPGPSASDSSGRSLRATCLTSAFPRVQQAPGIGSAPAPRTQTR
jgi:hypothetical protein